MQALVPRGGTGHQFVCYADSCCGLPGGPHEATFAAVNDVVARLWPCPEFICFPGDEIRGLTLDREALRRQWRYWLEEEMGWLDRQRVPVYHTTGNHTTYDRGSEAVFGEMLAHLPRNGPPGQEGLSYFVRRNDLLLVFVNTNWSGLGGEGRVESTWLNETLARHAGARYKLVFGHHPVFPVNGFSGVYQRQVEPESGLRFWNVLVRHGVTAYLCSHMLAFDVQVHDGVLQIMTAGAGTAPLMPAGIEYHHCLQAALDAGGLRYQVLDTAGRVR
ncbi:MAG: metallophosphoesterase family protein, partial [Anaerolineae bacterium]